MLRGVPVAAVGRGAVWFPGAPPPPLSQIAGGPLGAQSSAAGGLHPRPGAPGGSPEGLPGPNEYGGPDPRDTCVPRGGIHSEDTSPPQGPGHQPRPGKRPRPIPGKPGGRRQTFPTAGGDVLGAQVLAGKQTGAPWRKGTRAGRFPTASDFTASFPGGRLQLGTCPPRASAAAVGRIR